MATLVDHPLWPQLVPHLTISGSTSRGLNGARHRIEVRPSAPKLVMGITVPCAACGRWMFAVRERHATGDRQQHGRFVSVTCPLTVNVACARSQAARDATLAIRDAVAMHDAYRTRWS